MPSTNRQSSSPSWFKRLYRSVGFSKGYNFYLWFTFAGALFAFTLARLMYLDIPNVFCGPNLGMSHAAPGECYHYENFDRYAIGIRLHLFTILRYIVILLALVANAGALMIARKAFGGIVATQALVGTLFILTTGSLVMAYYNIKRLQIDQHRAWMLRTWFYFTSIITLRIIMIIAANILTSAGDFWSVQECAKVLDVLKDDVQALLEVYPACANLDKQDNIAAVTTVHVNMEGTAVEVMAALNESFGMSGWVAFALHAIGVEVHLQLTPQESRRLKEVSYERQSKAGHKYPGYSGLVVKESSEYVGVPMEISGELLKMMSAEQRAV